MPTRYHAQRLHIVSSVSRIPLSLAFFLVLLRSKLDTLLYQLHALSFFLSPSIWALFCRYFMQQQCVRPREFDTHTPRSLGVWLGLIAVVNAFSVYPHAKREGGVPGEDSYLGLHRTQYVSFGHLIVSHILSRLCSVETPTSLARLVHYVSPNALGIQCVRDTCHREHRCSRYTAAILQFPDFAIIH